MGFESFLDIEKPLAKLQEKIEELRRLNASGEVDLTTEIRQLEEKARRLKEEIFSSLSPWEKVQLARHAKRPTTSDYIKALFTDFVELHGDRLFSDDAAIVGGFAKFEGTPVVLIGHQKGRDTKDNLNRNFGMASPEGFRKAARLFKMAEKFNHPVFTFIDTPGAYPGIGAEERGQFMAIAENLLLLSRLKVPILVTVIGEGGSGGALALGLGDRVLILEHAVYSVISPEGCASILWRDAKKAPEAASFLHLTAQELEKLRLIDDIVAEPLGGAHQNPEIAFRNLKKAFRIHFPLLLQKQTDDLLQLRYQKYRRMGAILELPQLR